LAALQRSAVLGRMASQTGREPSKLLVSGRSFEDVVVQRMGSSVVAQRLFESQNPGACTTSTVMAAVCTCPGLHSNILLLPVQGRLVAYRRFCHGGTT
jgi:hypothetical protein